MPLAVMAQLCASPALIAPNESPPATSCGTVASGVVLPMPSRPSSLFPQQCASPVAVTAHVCASPPAIDVNLGLPLTAVGTSAFACVPLPSWPARFPPQQ